MQLRPLRVSGRGPPAVPARLARAVRRVVLAVDELEMVARQWPRTTLRNRTRLTREADGLVRIDVEITLSAPAPLFRYAFRQARAAHLDLATRLPAALAAARA